jgi:beta-glucosidase/6-phospho-beta-glucosidase/beta-galactosidase
MIMFQLNTKFPENFMWGGSCDSDDIQATIQKQHDTLFFSDVQARGYYPAYTARMLAEKNVVLEMQPEDEQIMREYPVDYVSFSYYMSSAVSAHPENLEGAVGNLLIGGIKNPYLSKRYGYIYVDQDDMGRGTKCRIKKKSFEWYKTVIASNGECLD